MIPARLSSPMALVALVLGALPPVVLAQSGTPVAGEKSGIAGTFDYVCVYHPAMTGTIVVE